MLKKMMALLVAISCAFGAWADVTGHLSGTDFSPLSAGSFVTGLDDSGNDTGSTYWFTGDPSDFEGTIVTNALGKKFLDFESNITNPLYRTISGCWGSHSPSEFVTTPIGTGLFLDTSVQFTPYLVNENHPAPTKLSNDDKLIVWVRETEVDGDANITNLIVTAGYYDAFEGLSASNYVVSLSSAAVSELCSNTNRLTIKSYSCITDKSGGPAGFVVYLNETALEYTADAFAAGCEILDDLAATPESYYEPGHHKLFPSLMGDLENYNKLSGVGYAGMGKIGDVIFDTYATDYPAFAADPINFRIVAGDGVESYYYNGVQYFADHADSVAPTVASVTISNVVYASGWEHKTGTWYNGTNVVNNAVGVGGDYGTFIFDNGTTLNLAGFQANYLVGETPYQTLFGGTVTEPVGAIAAAAGSGATFKLTKDTVINESGNVNIVVDTGDVLVIDLNGHTLRGSTGDETTFTIVNIGGSLTVTDSSVGQTGAVLGSIYNEASNQLAIQSTGAPVTNKLEAGTFEIVEGEYENDPPLRTGISGGKFLDLGHVDGEDDFYLQDQLNDGFEVVSWDQIGGDWYATIGASGVTTWDITFSTNNVVVTEWNLTVNDGDPIGNHIPNFTGGSWDVTPTAETVVNSDTNFNYTIETSYTLTYVSDHGAVPDGVVYTASTPDFALAAAPDPGVVGIAFAGWVIGSVTNEAGATFVVADHLENTTATAAWAPVVPTGTAIYLVMGSGVDSLSTSFNGTDWTAYTDALQDVELGSTLYIKGTSSVTGYDVPQFSIVVDNTHATEQTALVVNKSAIVYFPQTAIEQEWADRNGTAALPFVIRNYADLVALKNGVANGTITNQCFEQVADIDMDGEAAWTGIGAFKKVTAGQGAFEGTYDGGNYTIANVTLASAEYAGLFNSTVGAVIKNLTVDVDGILTDAAEYGAGAFVGTARDSFFTNLVATGTIGTEAAPANHSTGGLFVRFEGSVAYACTNRCEIWCSKNKVGGIAAIGQSARIDTFELCSNEGTIHATKTGALGDGGVGGIIGWPGYGTGVSGQPTTFINCRSIGQIVSSASDKTGSFVGERRGAAASLSGTNITLDGMRVVYSHQDGVTYGKSIGGGLVELCTQAAFETNNTYSTLWSGLTPTFEFSAPGTISFNTNLFAATAFAITKTGDLELDESESGGIVTFTASLPGPADPWAPDYQTDESASNKVVEIFGEGSDVAKHVNTLAEYGNLVAYITNVTSEATVPSDLTGAQKAWMWKSYILGANPLFDADVAVEITSLTANSEAGKWDFTVKVTEGESTDAYNVAADKVAALVKIRTSLTTGTWVTPAAGNIEAIKLLGGNLIKVTVNFGDGASGFMKVSE